MNLAKKKKKTAGQLILNGIFIIMCLLVLYPFIMLISASLSNEADLVKYGYKLIPKRIDLTAYKLIFENPAVVFNAYKITIIFSIIGTVAGVLCMSLIAYPLSRKDFRSRNKVSFYLFFTMLFSGGLVPSYILNTQYLHLNNTIWIYILPFLVSPWYVFMMRTFFAGIPNEIIESARMDGAKEFRILFQFVYPLSKPVLAAIALFTLLERWNDWMTALLYIDDSNLISLQYLLQSMMKNAEMIMDAQNAGVTMDMETIPSETLRMAMAMVVAGPALIVFPFFQKYFVQGLTVGSVKG